MTVLSGDVVTRTGELVLQPVRLLTKLNGEGGMALVLWVVRAEPCCGSACALDGASAM